jgi:ssDNA-binding Zn-finger/Zn-ribbon topoisomerase 1
MEKSPLNPDEYRCPSCGGPMKHGYIAGHWFRFRWVEKAKTKTIFAGRPLRRKIDFWNSPTVEAARCEKCKTGIFIYDN